VDVYQDQKDAYRGVIAAISDGDLAALDVFLAQDLIDHNPMPGQAPGIIGFKQWASAVRSSFPDFRGSVETVLAEGNLVAGRVTWLGTQRGSFLGVPPSDREVEIAAFHIVRLSAGRIVEWWGTADLLGVLEELGARIIPPPA
jgi:predicted ester cyclase